MLLFLLAGMAFDDEIPDFDLDGDEQVVLNVGPVEVDPDLGQHVWLVGKLLAQQKAEPLVFRSVMLKLWESRNCIEIRHVGTNLFAFQFAAQKDRDLVLKSGPWLFNRHLVALNLFDIAINPATIPLTRVPFWVQVHGLPFTMRTEKTARLLGGTFDGFIDWDRYAARRYGVCLRMRVWVNIERPLRHGQMVAVTDGAPLKVSFKYEKLVNMCFRCGRVDHVIFECAQEDNGQPNRYGAWMRAEGEGFRRRNGGARREYGADEMGIDGHEEEGGNRGGGES